MPKRAAVFASFVIISGGAVAAGAALLWEHSPSGLFYLCAVMAVFGATLKVPVPGMTGTISPSFVPLLFSIGQLGWCESVVLASLAGVTQCVWRPKRRPTLVQVAFNGATFAISTLAAYFVAHSVASSKQILLFVVAAAIFQVVDTFLVATILSLLADGALRTLWSNCHFWAFPYHLVGGLFAALWSQAHPAADISICMIVGLVLFMMSAFYREVVSRMGRVTI